MPLFEIIVVAIPISMKPTVPVIAVINRHGVYDSFDNGFFRSWLLNFPIDLLLPLLFLIPGLYTRQHGVNSRDTSLDRGYLFGVWRRQLRQAEQIAVRVVGRRGAITVMNHAINIGPFIDVAAVSGICSRYSPCQADYHRNKQPLAHTTSTAFKNLSM